MRNRQTVIICVIGTLAAALSSQTMGYNVPSSGPRILPPISNGRRALQHIPGDILSTPYYVNLTVADRIRLLDRVNKALATKNHRLDQYQQMEKMLPKLAPRDQEKLEESFLRAMKAVSL